MNQHHSLPESCANTVPIKVNRVFDSCSDRDCFSNIQILMDGEHCRRILQWSKAGAFVCPTSA